jgi:hypothetical protein
MAREASDQNRSGCIVTMAMSDYLKEIDYAARRVVQLIWRDRERLLLLEAKVALLTKQVQSDYGRGDFIAMNSEDADDVGIATGIYWETYFGADKDRYHKNKKLEKLVKQLAVRSFSFEALAGSLLQYGKQGVSLAHGGFANSPNGRSVGSQFLKHIIWQGRNQAIHWEEGNPHAPVQTCFEKLEKEFDRKFGEYKSRSMAADVVALLGWKTFPLFRSDMLSLN